MCGEKSESDAGRGQIGEGGLKKEERRESDRLCPKFDKQAGARGVIVGLPAPSLLFNLRFPLPNDEAPPQERSAATSLSSSLHVLLCLHFSGTITRHFALTLVPLFIFSHLEC